MINFAQKVYEMAKKIPKGKVVTYGQLAAAVGNPKAARAVGGAMRTNPYAPIVPCHRIVAASGKLTGYSAEGGVAKKKQMLMEEGVRFIGDRVDMKKYKVREDFRLF